jgi:hypothetical protein
MQASSSRPVNEPVRTAKPWGPCQPLKSNGAALWRRSMRLIPSARVDPGERSFRDPVAVVINRDYVTAPLDPLQTLLRRPKSVECAVGIRHGNTRIPP